MRKYSIQLNSNYDDYFDVFNNESMEVMETFENIQDAKNYLIKLEQIEWLKQHEYMTFVYKYNKRRFNLHVTSDGYYMDCIDFDKNGKSLSCTQNYKLNKGLPGDNSYILLSETSDKELIEKTINEKLELIEKWQNLNSMKKQYMQLLTEVGMLKTTLLKL